MFDADAVPSARNGRPDNTHDRHCHDTPEDAELHREHSAMDAVCANCGCCWGREPDCCAEYTCPNAECGCSVTTKGDAR